MFKAIEQFMDKRPVLGVALVAVGAVVIASASGLLAPPTQLLSRFFGSIRATVLPGSRASDKRAA